MNVQEIVLLIAGIVSVCLIAARIILRARRSIRTFAGSVVLITGGSSGLGLLLARRFARDGSKLILVARKKEELAQAKAELDSISAHPVETLAVDISNRAAVSRLVSYVMQRHGRADVLVNNTAVIQVGPPESLNLEDFEEAMNTHYWGPLMLIWGFLPGMRSRKQGRIVNISSSGGLVSAPDTLPYSASKFALSGVSEGLRAQLLADDVFVTTVCPGHDPEQGTDQIMDAIRNGDAELTITRKTQLIARLHGLVSRLVSDLFSLRLVIIGHALKKRNAPTEIS